MPAGDLAADPFQTAVIKEITTKGKENYITFPLQQTESEGCRPGRPCGPPRRTPIDASMTAGFSSFQLRAGQGAIGGDVLEFDVTITNTSADARAVLTAFAFQSKFSESPALASRIGDKLFSATAVPGSVVSMAQHPLTSVKKNGTSNGLLGGKWKGICVNSSSDYLPQFNAGLLDESLECAGGRTDGNGDGLPELPVPVRGLKVGESQTIRLRLDSGTTDGALHQVPKDTLTGTVGQRADGFPRIATAGSVLEIVEFADNKVFFNVDGDFDPPFAPKADGFSLAGNEYLTFPRVNFAFSDILGRNHSCATYGLGCSGSPLLSVLGTGDLVAGAQNFAAMLHGFGEFVETSPGVYALPNQPYGVRCTNCGGRPFVPMAEFYVDNGNGTVTRQIAAGSYGALGTPGQYLATVDPVAVTTASFKQEVLDPQTGLETDPGGPPRGTAFGALASATFHDLEVQPGAGANGGDVVAFNLTIRNDSPATSGIHLTAFNIQSKRRGLADISPLDGTSQDRRDIRLDADLRDCNGPDDGVCWNQALGIGHFPNVIGNGLLFAQMVWPTANAHRSGQPVDGDQVFVDPSKGIAPTNFWLESVKKNAPFPPIVRQAENFICVKSGLFSGDPDADALCAGEPAILKNPNQAPVKSNIKTRLGLPPQKSQTVRLRMDFGDFRGVLLRIQPGSLPDSGLRRIADCSDQRELEFCHPDVRGQNIGYLPGTTATWLTPTDIDNVEYVILNQPGTAPTVMNFAENFGVILAMAGFRPTAEFYKPDRNGALIREQVIGEYGILPPT